VEPECGGGLLLLRHVTPLPRRDVVYFYSGAHNTDTNGKVWNSGEVISKVFLANIRRPSMIEKFALLDNAYEQLGAHGKVLNHHRRLEKQLAALDRKIAAWTKVFLPEKQMNELLQRANMFEVGDKAAPTAWYWQDVGRSQPGRVDPMQLPAALDRRPQAAATWSQRGSVCARHGIRRGTTSRR
jgi:hypothetical protein